MDETAAFLARLPADLRPLVRRSVLLRDLTTLRIGGPAELVCPIQNPSQAQRFQELARQVGLPSFILGGGSNLLAADEGFAGVVLLVATDRLAQEAEIVTAGAGLVFDQLIAGSLDRGLTGLEFASGIPGTVGGALVGNAGCYGHEIGEFLLDALVLLPDGSLTTLGAADFGFGYRTTRVRETGAVILEARFRLERGDAEAARLVRLEKIRDRRLKHPVDLPSAGSWFRNLPPERPGGLRRAAGQLLEQAGAKDMREGDAQVFEKHANIIVNAGRATCANVLRLAARMKQAVKERFGVELQEEVRRLGP